MMQAAEAVCRERGLSTIRLEVSTKNLVAIEFYRRLGYRTDGVLYGYYSWGEDAYSMHKAIVPTTSAADVPPLMAASHLIWSIIISRYYSGSRAGPVSQT